MGIDPLAIRMVFGRAFWRMAVLWTLTLIASKLRLLAYCFPSHHLSTRSFKRRRFTAITGPAIERPVCIITGASSGLGAAAARELAAEGYYVLLAGRSSESLYKTVNEIKQQHSGASLKAFQVDLTSIDSITNFEASVRKWLLDSNMHPSIQLLINNAGILATSSRVTSDGYDYMMATNYLGPFVLTNLLLPLLKNSPVHSRIVNVSSFTHRCVFSTVVRDGILAGNPLMSTSGNYNFAHVYELSKLSLLLFSYELHRQLYVMDPTSKVSVIAADPGFVRTNIMREIPPCLSWLSCMALGAIGLLQSPSDGVSSIIDAALAPPEVSGEYFFGGNGRTLPSSKLSGDAELGKELYSDSFKGSWWRKSRGEAEIHYPPVYPNFGSRRERLL